MRVVLDSNVLLVSIARKSPYRPIFDALLSSKFELAVSTEILSEYGELIEQKANAEVSQHILEMLIHLNNVHLHDVYFKWNLISQDPDDNKFVDVSISSGAEYLVTEDRHFGFLTTIPFPKVPVIGIADFLKIISTL
jgi:putative PIN family toxin of toxin-antitoxin system